MTLPPALEQTLVAVADAMRSALEPWWVVAGAAAALHGALEPPVADVDVLLGAEDALRLLPAWGLPALPGAPSRRFRSEVFATWRAAPLPVEFMAGFRLRTAAGWEPVLPATREPVRAAGATVYVPARAELVATLERFGRPKDLERARQLRRG